MSRYCTSCGSVADNEETTCSVCGEPLPSIEDNQQDASAVTTPAPPSPPSAVGSYITAAVAVIILSFMAFLLFRKEEVKGPPDPRNDQAAAGSGAATDAATGGKLPPGHPQMGAPAGPTPEQAQQIKELEARVAANPTDLALKLTLANLYYDVNRDAEAVPLYRAYLAANPADTNARTDMAVSLANTGRVDSAIVELKQVVKANPHYQPAAFNMAIMYFNKRQRDSLMVWLRRTVEIDSTSRQGGVALSLLREAQRPDTSKGIPQIGQ